MNMKYLHSLLNLANYITLVLIFGLFLSVATEAFATIAIRGGASNYTTGNSTNSSMTINKPSGVLTGDVMIVNIVKYGSNTTPSLSGWTLIDGSELGGSTIRYGAIMYRIVDGTEGVSFTFALGTNSYAAGSIIAFSGVDVSGSNPFDVAPGSISTGTSQTLTITSITTNNSDAAVIMFGMNSSNPARSFSSWSTTSPTLSEVYDYTGATYETVGAAWALKATAGTTGPTSSLTISGTGAYIGGILLALKPAVPVPTITGFTNSPACSGSGASVVVTGTNFTGATAVKFNGVTATFNADNATQITATLPAGATTGKIAVTTPGGTGTSSSDFTVNTLPPHKPGLQCSSYSTQFLEHHLHH